MVIPSGSNFQIPLYFLDNKENTFKSYFVSSLNLLFLKIYRNIFLVFLHLKTHDFYNQKSKYTKNEHFITDNFMV
jgi:hypothetical protein